MTHLSSDTSKIQAAHSTGERRSWDMTFSHLLEVCREAMSRGNPRPAEVLLISCKTEAKLCAQREEAIERTLTAKRDLTRTARDKTRAVAEILGKGIDIPPGPDVASPFTTVKARRRRDPLANLALSDEQIAAADEIVQVFEALTLSLHGTVRPLLVERVDVSTSNRAPFQDMPGRLAEAHADRYLPWAKRQKEVVAERKGKGVTIECLTGHSLTIAVLIDKVPVRTLEGRYRIRNGILAQRLRVALDDYWPAGQRPVTTSKKTA